MFTQNKWYNLGIFVLVAIVVCLVIQSATKVVDKDGKETGKLKAFNPGAKEASKPG